jgi:homoserine dehydrogenase
MTLKIALLGMGAVGRGILHAVAEKDIGLIITAVADSRSGCIDPKGLNLRELLVRKEMTGICGDVSINAETIVKTAPYDILVEMTPTEVRNGEPATTYIRHALSRGCHVVTSNKGPVALHYHELSSLARNNKVQFRFEATVAGAIPIIQTLMYNLGGNELISLYGVLNGTCNYILTRMAEEGLTYKQALDEARTLGYAEADPTYDVKGIDAAIKLVILANTVWKKKISLDDVDVTGIDLLTEEALRLAEQQDATIRLIGEIIPEQNIYRLCPRIIPKDHPLVVQGSLNAIIVRTDLAGDLLFVGKGAGSHETASAVFGDILSIRDLYAGGN